MQDFNNSVADIGSREVMEMMLITQYFDMLRDVGANGKASTVFIPHQPGGIHRHRHPNPLRHAAGAGRSAVSGWPALAAGAASAQHSRVQALHSTPGFKTCTWHVHLASRAETILDELAL